MDERDRSDGQSLLWIAVLIVAAAVAVFAVRSRAHEAPESPCQQACSQEERACKDSCSGRENPVECSSSCQNAAFICRDRCR